ncbi:MAG: hypothetical protein ABEJ03_00270 [Candidatus Nanohaloarchaea archaeon]
MAVGEVKAENGKLVKVEREEDGVRLTGDFFLEPPEARKKIENRLENQKEDAGESEVASSLEDLEADFIGFSPEDVAEAYIRAGEDK